jgi:hypothetical protein
MSATTRARLDEAERLRARAVEEALVALVETLRKMKVNANEAATEAAPA